MIENNFPNYSQFFDNLIKNSKPSLYISLLNDENELGLFPEVQALTNTMQDPIWHPEGNVFVHTMMVIDEAAIIKERLKNDTEKIILMFAALCHDFGKPATTFEKNGRIVSPKHEAKGAEPTTNFMKRFNMPDEIIAKIVELVREHLRPATLYKDRHNVSMSAIRRLMYRVDLEMLLLVAEADHFGRTTEDAIERDFPAGKWLYEQYMKLSKRHYQPKAFLNGNILMDLGYPQGRLLGQILRTIYGYQLRRKITSYDEALVLLEKLFPIKKYTKAIAAN